MLAHKQSDVTCIDGTVNAGTQAIRCELHTDSIVNAGTQAIRRDMHTDTTVNAGTQATSIQMVE